MQPLKIVPYEENWRARWDDFAAVQGTIFHRSTWLQSLQECFGYQVRHHLVLDNQNQIAALFPLFVTRNLRGQKVGVALPFTHYVSVAARDESAKNFLLEQCQILRRALNLHYLELRLDCALPKNEKVGLNQENVTFVLPLAGSEKSLLGMASSDNRRRTRLVYEGNCFQTSFDKRRLAEWYEVFARRQKQLGSPAPALTFFARIDAKMPANVVLLTVLDRRLQKVVGGMFLLADGAQLYYHWGATRIEYNPYHLNHFMYREALKFALENGFQSFDFGRSPRSGQGGTYRFKEQFGAVAKPLFYYRFSDNPHEWGNIQQSMKPLVEGWKKMPRFLTDTAGPHLIGRALP